MDLVRCAISKSSRRHINTAIDLKTNGTFIKILLHFNTTQNDYCNSWDIIFNDIPISTMISLLLLVLWLFLKVDTTVEYINICKEMPQIRNYETNTQGDMGGFSSLYLCSYFNALDIKKSSLRHEITAFSFVMIWLIYNKYLFVLQWSIK